MTQTNKCQHDGEMKTGWDELTCKKCGWDIEFARYIEAKLKELNT